MEILKSWLFDVDNLAISDIVFIKKNFTGKKLIISLPAADLSNLKPEEVTRLKDGKGYILGSGGDLYTITGGGASDKGKPGTGNALDDPGKIS